MASIADKSAKADSFLLCDLTGNTDVPSLQQHWAFGLIECLDRAVDEHPVMITVRFGGQPRRCWTEPLELCRALKRNSRTQGCLILVLLRDRHRDLLEKLAALNVDFVKYIGEIRLDLTRMEQLLADLGPDDGLERQLTVICPFLHYCPIDARQEMTVCGAYLDRLVLGGRRLNEFCETEKHHGCEYYLNPRSAA